MSTKKWPNEKKFALCITHDIDRVKKTYQVITHFLRDKRIYHLKSIFLPNPYWNFEKIMKIEEKYDVRSTFFFLNESKKFQLFKPSEYKITLNKYDIHNEKISSIIKKLDREGWEIGVHGSYESYCNKALLQKEKKELEEIIGKKIIGIRQHYLNLDIPQTWEMQRNLGFKYDSSLGSSKEIGFKYGYEPIHPFNDDFVVFPLTVMDVALFKNTHSIQNAWDTMQKLLEKAKTHNAVMTILWHGRVFSEIDFPGYSEIYKRTIEKAIKMSAWVGSCGELYRYLEG